MNTSATSQPKLDERKDHSKVVPTSDSCRSARKYLLPLLILFVLVTVPWALRTLTSKPNELKAEQEIRQMTESQREKLNHQFQKFNHLPPAKRDLYRNLHQTLHQPSAEHAELRTILDRYEIWVKDLTLEQWDQLRQQQDPVAKAEIVASLFLQQEESAAKLEDIVTGKISMEQRRGVGFFSRLPFKNFPRAAEILEETLPSHLQPAAKVTGASRHIQVLRSLVTHLKSQDPKTRKAWPPEEIRQEIQQAMLPSTMESFYEKLSPSEKKGRLVGLLIMGLFHEISREATPNEEQLKRFIQTLPRTEREAILSQSSRDARRTFIGKYQYRVYSKLSPQLVKLRQEFMELDPDLKIPRALEAPRFDFKSRHDHHSRNNSYPNREEGTRPRPGLPPRGPQDPRRSFNPGEQEESHRTRPLGKFPFRPARREANELPQGNPPPSKPPIPN